MLSLIIPIDDTLLKAVTAKAEQRGLTTGAFAVEALRVATTSDAQPLPVLAASVPGVKEYALYLAAALQRINSLNVNDLFTLNGNHKGINPLFSAEDWNKMKVQSGFAPTKFGKRFLLYIQNYNKIYSPIVEIMGKTSDNKQIYKKIAASGWLDIV